MVVRKNLAAIQWLFLLLGNSASASLRTEHSVDFDRQKLVCFQPLEVKTLRRYLLSGNLKKAVDWDHPPKLTFPKSDRLSVRSWTGPWSSGGGLNITVAGVRRTVPLKALTMGREKLALLQYNLIQQSHRISNEETRLLLRVNSEYHVFAPDLVEEVTYENLRQVMAEKHYSAFKEMIPEEELNMLLDEMLEEYKSSPVELLGWNELEKLLSSRLPFSRLLLSSFTVFEGGSSAIILSGSMRYLTVCVPETGDVAAAAQLALKDLRSWMQSRNVMKLLSCEAYLEGSR